MNANPIHLEGKHSKHEGPYAFQKWIDEQKHLDTDELRHTIKPVIHNITRNFKGEEHKYCDKIKLCPLGKFKRPDLEVEMERRGFTTLSEMANADKKAEEDTKQKQIDDLRAYKKLSEERFDKLGSLIEQLMNERLAKK